MNEYDITEAFRKIENELIASMIRNMDRHRAEEDKEGKEWSMWQVEQLKYLEKYKLENQKKYKKQFKKINQAIVELISEARERGSMEQEIEILEAIQKGFKGIRKISRGMTGEFFKLNDRKLEALIKATTHDMEKAEVAILRMANDQYRKAIFNAQVYANSGAGTYEKAVDMATKDMLAAGLNCVVYANGARHTLSDYANMAIRTASKRAYLQGEGEKRQEWGISTVIVNKRGNPCPKCLPFVGKVMIDDVWSGGKKEDGPYPLMSTAVKHGLYHPNCKDSHTTYFKGISTADDTWTKEELEEIGDNYKKEQKQQYAERQAEKYERLSEYSLDDENQKRYAARREEWKRRSKAPENIKEAISKIRSDVEKTKGILNSLEAEEKELTKKVYFDLTATAEETQRLKEIVGQKVGTKENLKQLEEQLFEKQEIYKNAAEKRLIESGTIKEVKFSKRMTPEAVDEIERTLYSLKEKYGIMPNGVIFNPQKVPDATAMYNWIDDNIYISNRFNDLDRYLEIVQESEDSLQTYREHYKIAANAKKELEKQENILSDKSVKGYERSKAQLAKAAAEIDLKVSRQAVRESVSDALVHEYGHFIHRHAEADFIQKKNVFGMKELGGKMVNGDWMYEVNTAYSRTGKVRAAAISNYATESPYETFAEGFLALHKGEEIPEHIENVIRDAMEKAGVKSVEKISDSGIMKMNLQTFAHVPKEKLVDYALNPEHPIGKEKAKAFRMALGYTQENSEELREKVLELFNEEKLVLKDEDQYGKRYEQIMEITGPNGKTANVLTAWISENESSEPRLTTLYVTDKEDK